jgi:hypothetical protein
MRYLSFLLLLTLASCGTAELRRTDDSTPYRTSGVEQFFLPELPRWANSSEAGQCFKNHSFIYLDFPKLAASYQLTYPQMIELQAQYNERVESYFRSTTVRFLKPVEESSFFSNTLEQVRGGIRHFKLPAVKEVEVVWLDSYIKENKVDALKKLAASGRFDEKLPIIFSACLSRMDINHWLSENNLEQAGFFILSGEWLNPYGSDQELQAGLKLELDKLFDQKTKVGILSVPASHHQIPLTY